MKKLSLILVVALVISLLAGCAGTPVIYYTECDCPEGGVVVEPAPAPQDTPAADVPAAEGALKTGLSISTSLAKSAAATADEAGKADYAVTMVAVLVDDNGVIQQCVIDGIAASVAFDATGTLAELPEVATKNELGEAYNMVAWGGAIAEWDAQAAAFADYVVGKTVDEVTGIAVDEATKPTDADLKSSVTISVGDFQTLIAKAVANAQHLGAQAGDVLKLTAVNTAAKSTSATAEKDGTAQLDSTVTAVTFNGDTVTSCIIDAVQAKVSFNTAGEIVSDVTAPVQTKNELGENYGMVAWGGAIAEWDAQAASFAAYVTGKTVDEVTGIAVDEDTKPTDADLKSSVTISVGDFMALIAKAAQ